MAERGGTTVMVRPGQKARPAARSTSEPTVQTRRPAAPRSGDAPREVPPAAPEERRAPASRSHRRPDGSLDLGAWVFGVVLNGDDTPDQPFKQGLVRANPPPEPAPRVTLVHRRPAPAAPRPASRSEAHARPAPRSEAHARPASRSEAHVRPAPRSREHTRPVPRPEPAARPAVPAPVRPAAPASPPARGQPFDLAAWVFGLVPQHEVEEPAAPPRRRPPPAPKRKALTMPDLFDGPAVPPCLEDD